jgi:hypothetical protein
MAKLKLTYFDFRGGARSNLDRSYGWRAVAILAEIGRASVIGLIP